MHVFYMKNWLNQAVGGRSKIKFSDVTFIFESFRVRRFVNRKINSGLIARSRIPIGCLLSTGFILAYQTRVSAIFASADKSDLKF